MYKCCVFDLDGTVADTLDTIAYYGNYALQHFGLPEIDKERYKYLVGNGYKILVRNMLREIGRDENDPIFHELAGFYHDAYDKGSMYLTKAYDGMPELLNSLKEKGLKLAVLSNKPHGAVITVADELYGGIFDICYGSREDVPLKPDPALLFEILEKFNIKPQECVYVGDTSTDMLTGKKAGAFTVGVLWGFRDREFLAENGAKLFVANPLDIVDMIN